MSWEYLLRRIEWSDVPNSVIQKAFDGETEAESLFFFVILIKITNWQKSGPSEYRKTVLTNPFHYLRVYDSAETAHDAGKFVNSSPLSLKHISKFSIALLKVFPISARIPLY